MQMMIPMIVLVFGSWFSIADNELPPGKAGQAGDDIKIEIKTQIEVLKKNSNWGSSQEAAKAAKRLVAIGKPAVPSLVELLKSEKWMDRYRAGLTLARIGTDAKSAVPAIKKSIETEKHLLVSRRLPLFLTSIETGPKGVVTYINKKKRFETTDNAFAAWLLSECRDDASEAIPALKELVKNFENENHRTTIETAIKKIEDRSKKAAKEPSVK